MPSIPIVLTTYNRPKALAKTLKSLAATDVMGLEPHLFIEDDGSGDEALEIIQSVFSTDAIFPWGAWQEKNASYGRRRKGPNRNRRLSLWRVFEDFKKEFPFVVTIESDAVFHPSWLKKLIQFYMESAQPDGTMKNEGWSLATISPYRSRLGSTAETDHGTWVHRQQTGGVCHLIPREWYDRGKEKDGWMAWEMIEDWNNNDVVWGLANKPNPVWGARTGGWDYKMVQQAHRMGRTFGCLKPSLVDHRPGPEGTTSGSRIGVTDHAVDFVGE